jgi:DNA (cytosine-5)-methyltransferase 1
MKLRVIELFGGIGACSKAIERLGISYEIADYVEIDKYAVKSFNAIHGTNFEPQDIKEWNKDIEADLIMHGSPCQDFSVAGKGAGGDKDSGTRSSLMYETLRIVEKLKPKYVIWENVKNLLSKKHIHNFEAYQEAMRNLGYVNYYKVLNAKDYGVPQNRERVFTVSIRNDICDNTFEFPEKMVLEKKLKDILDEEVDEKYYIKDATSLTIGSNFDTINGGVIGKMHDISRRAYHEDAIAPTMHTCGGGNTEPKIVASRGRYNEDSDIEQHLEPRKDGLTNTITSVQKDNYVAIKTANKQGYDLAKDGDGIDLAYPNSTTRRGRVGHGVSKTLACSDTMGTYQNYRIRKLTPKECWRLMGFDDSDFEKAEKVNSNSQLYKQAGNSIVVNVLEGILRNLLCKTKM